jgi:hypothetical protein
VNWAYIALLHLLHHICFSHQRILGILNKLRY